MKLYDEKEIGLILKRAAELSRTTPRDPALGLSLEEIKELGAEAGIDPSLIIRAATETERVDAPAEKNNFFGGPMSLTREVVLEAPVDAVEWEEMLVHIRECFSDPGSVSMREGIFEWTSRDRNVKSQVTVRQVDGRSHLSVFWHEPSIGILPFILTMIGSIMSIPIVLEAMGLTGLAAFGVWLSMACTLFLLSRTIAVTVKKKRLRTIDKMISRIERASERSELKAARRTVGTSASTRHQDDIRLSLEEPEDHETEGPEPGRSSRTRER